MGALRFDDEVDVNPQMKLAETFREWVVVLASQRSRATTSGYVSDASTFARGLLAVVSKPAPDVPAEPAETPAVLRARDGTWLVSPAVYDQAVTLLGALSLSDLHPRNLALTLDRVGVNRSASTQRRIASAWGSFCALLVRRGFLAANPMKHDAISLPRKPHPNPHPINYADAERMAQTILRADEQSREPWPSRDFALCSVFLTLGLRVSEAAKAAVDDLETHDSTPRLRVRGKGNKDRTLPVHPSVVVLITSYLEERRERLGSYGPSDPLFVRANGESLDRFAISRLVERWYVRAAVRRQQGTLVHALRHTFATSALDDGANLLELQILLGHSSLETTKRYVALVGNSLYDAIAAHPMRRMLDDVTSGELDRRPPTT